MADNFEKDGVLADLGISKPNQILTVKYGGATFNPGQELTPTQVKDEPEVTWDADPNSLYALYMQNQSLGEGLHWAIINIPGNRIKDGDVRAEYIGSGPNVGTGLHRYIFMVFKQGGRIPLKGQVIRNNTSEGRTKTKISEIAAELKLEGPVAANYYNSQYDDYVPILYKQLGLI